MSFYEIAWVIFVYSFLGWCAEVVFAACRRGIFVNRGFLNGPVCPIYGFGMALVLALLTPVKDSFLPLFFGSMLLTTALEFFIGFIMERFFHDKWWDYSDNPFNIKGYVCLRGAHEAFDEQHPELHEKSVGVIKEVLDKRSEINTAIKEKEDARAARIAELEGKIAATLSHNIVHERIVRAYPQLAEGKHSGRVFKRLAAIAERRRTEKHK